MKKIKEINSHDIEMATLNKSSYVVTDNSYNMYSNSLGTYSLGLLKEDKKMNEVEILDLLEDKYGDTKNGR